MFFLSWIIWFGDKCMHSCIAKADPYGAGYKRNGNFLYIVNKLGRNKYKRSVTILQGWP